LQGAAKSSGSQGAVSKAAMPATAKRQQAQPQHSKGAASIAAAAAAMDRRSRNHCREVLAGHDLATAVASCQLSLTTVRRG